MADEKNNLPDNNSEEIKNTEKKKPNKKLIIGIVAAVAVVAIVVGIIVSVSSGGKEKYTEKPVSTTAGDSQGDSAKPGIVNGELVAPTTENSDSSADNNGNSGSNSGGSGNSSSGGNSGSNSDNNSGSDSNGKDQKPAEVVPVNRKLHIEITLPNDGAQDDVLFVLINGEQLDLSGGSREDKGYSVKTDGSVFVFDTDKEYKGSVTVEASLEKYGKPAKHTSGINDTIIKVSLPLARSEEGVVEF